jgi:hypothetical protein
VARARVLAVLATLSVGACATAPREPWVLSSDGLRAPLHRDVGRISTYPEALATTLDIMQRDLGLPTVQVKLVFLPDARRLRDLLVRIGYPPTLAREAAREMAAIGGHRIVLINQARLESQGWPARLALLAHELGHVLQYELAGGKRGTSAQWLREGLSDWLGLRVMETLDRAERGKAWSRALARVRSPDRAQVMTLGGPGSLPEWVERVPSRVRLPSLSALGSFPDWVQQLRGEAGGALYEYAFVAVSTLVEERGLPAVLHYFALFAEREDPAANFLEAFGQTEAQFEDRLQRVVWP